MNMRERERDWGTGLLRPIGSPDQCPSQPSWEEGSGWAPATPQHLLAARPRRLFPELSTFLLSPAAESGQGAFRRKGGRPRAFWDPANPFLVPTPSGLGPKHAVRGGDRSAEGPLSWCEGQECRLRRGPGGLA